MPLRRLASLERKKIEEEFKQVSEAIERLKALLASPIKMRQEVIEELRTVKNKYGDARRTQIIHLGEGEKATELLTQTDVMPLEHFWVEVSETGLLSRTDGDTARRLGGAEAPWNMLRTNTHETIFLVTTEGRCAAIHSLAIPTQKPDESGVPASKIAPLHKNEILQGIFAVPIENGDLPERYVVTVTRQGMIKRSSVADLPGASASSFVLVKTNDNDELFKVLLTDGNQDLLLTTAKGMSIRFGEAEVRSMGLVAAGVNAIKLKEGDWVVGASTISDKDEVALVSRTGMGKRMPASEYPVQGRYGQGVISWKMDGKDEVVAQLVGKLTDKGICHFRKSASKVLSVTNAPARKRSAQGQAVFGLKNGDEVIGFTSIEDMSDYWGMK